MHIIKQSEFVKLPAGVFYMHYEPCNFGDLRIKGDTRSQNDWHFTPTDTIDSFDTGQWLERLDDMVRNGASYPLDFEANLTRHGMYDPDDSLIAVLDRTDVVGLIALLNKSLEVLP
jgi:hypothetical protein